MSGTAWATTDDDNVETLPQGGAPAPNRSRRILKAARVIFNDAYCGIDCIVLDLTPDNALLQADNAYLCPDEFQLKMLSGEAYACELGWREGTKIGFSILSDDDKDETAEELRATA